MLFRDSMEMQAEMFNRMCSMRSSEMNIDELECKDTNDAQSEDIELFNNQLWKDPGLSSSKRDYDINIFHNYDKSDNLLNDSNL